MIAHRLLIGAIGQGVFRSLDEGANFLRAADGMFVECDVRALVVDPADGHTLYLGSQEGVFVSRDGADSWQILFAPPRQEAVWSIAVASRRIVVGTCPSGVYFSEDAGATWSAASTEMTIECPRIRHTRVTSLLIDPDDPQQVWAGVEIDGIHQSADGGRTWRRLDAPGGSQAPGRGLTSADIHALAVAVGGDRSRRLFATTNRDINVSLDNGQTWRGLGIDRVMPWLYCRSLQGVCGQPGTLLLGNGTGPPGWEGVIGRTVDGGTTWAQAKMPARANSTIWAFAVHPADPGLVYAASVSGQVYRSLDAGANWDRLPREFGEIRALAWIPS